jgi:nitrite reductase/ring-hydroxylating ferredoxin subunit
MKLTPLCPADDVWEGAIRQAVLPDGRKLALYLVGGEFFATDDTCTHGAASLSEDGCVVGDKVECSWHNGQFEIRTGAACAMPCSDALRTWPVQVVDGHVCVLLPDT